MEAIPNLVSGSKTVEFVYWLTCMEEGSGRSEDCGATRIVRESADPCSDGFLSGNGKLNWQGALAPSGLSRTAENT